MFAEFYARCYKQKAKCAQFIIEAEKRIKCSYFVWRLRDEWTIG